MNRSSAVPSLALGISKANVGSWCCGRTFQTGLWMPPRKPVCLATLRRGSKVRVTSGLQATRHLDDQLKKTGKYGSCQIISRYLAGRRRPSGPGNGGGSRDSCLGFERGARRSGKLELRVGNMSDSELGRKWDRCLADAVVKIGKGFLVSGRPQPEPISWLKAPLTRRAEEKPRERSGRLACSIPSDQGELSGPGQEVTTAAGDADSRSLGGCPRWEGWRGSPEEVGVGLAGGRRVGELCELKQYAGRNLGLEAGNSPPSCHISRTGRAAWPGGHLPPLLNQKCPLRRSSGAFYRYCQALT